jgi:hypothetical protein
MATFNRRTNTRDEEFLGGKSPYEGTLGPNKSADIFSRYAGGLKKTNPRQASFDSDSRTFSDVAPASQQKIDDLRFSAAPSFGNEGDNSFAQSFLDKYRDGVVRGFIAPEDEVRPENLDRIISQDAYAASMERSPNTAGKFPGANGVNV